MHSIHPHISITSKTEKLDVCETQIPLAATTQKSGKISKSYILTPHNPQGHVMLVKGEQPIDELTVQV